MNKPDWPPRAFKWYNGCSWWRLGFADDQMEHAAILRPCVDSDGHPNLVINDKYKALIEHAPLLYQQLLQARHTFVILDGVAEEAPMIQQIDKALALARGEK